jgi:hypothetical protein
MRYRLCTFLETMTNEVRREHLLGKRKNRKYVTK